MQWCSRGVLSAHSTFVNVSSVAIVVEVCTLATDTDMEDGGGSNPSSLSGGVGNGGGGKNRKI